MDHKKIFKPNTRISPASTLIVLLLLILNVSTASAQLTGPVDPPPLGVVFSQSGTPNDGSWGRSGGKNYSYSNVNHANNTDVYWGVADGEVKLSLDGNGFTPSEIMGYDATLSNLPGGVVYWSGVTSMLSDSTVFTRFRLVFTDGVTGAPLALTLATDVGLAADVGAVFKVVNSAAEFDVNLLFMASNSDTAGFEPHLDFFDPRSGASEDGRAHSSLVRGFYYINTPPFITSNANSEVDEGGTVTIDSAHLSADDYESGPEGLTFTLNPQNQGGTPQYGELDNGGTPLSTDDVFTQADINADLIHYAHDGTETTLDGFNFTVHDEEGLIASDGPHTLFKHTLNITPVNDPPIATDGSGLASIDGTYAGVFSAYDAEQDPIEFSVVSVDIGAAEIVDEFSGAFAYEAPPGFIGDATIEFQVWDGNSFADVPGIFVVTVPDPSLAVLNSGDLLIANGDKLIIHNLPENKNWVLSSGNNFTVLKALDFDGENSIYVLDKTNGLIRVDPATGEQTVVATGDNFTSEGPGNIAVEDLNHVLVANLDIGGGPTVMRVDITNGSIVTEFSGDLMLVPTAVAVSEDGKVYAADASAFMGGASEIVEINPLSGAQSSISEGGYILLPFSIAVEPDGNILVADAPVGVVGEGSPVNRILRIDPSPPGGTDSPSGLSPEGQTILTESGEIALALTDVTAGYDGKIYAANGTNVIAVDPVSGAQTLVNTEAVVDKPTDVIVYFKEGIFKDSFEGEPPQPN